MNWDQALTELSVGKKVKLPEWDGYWFKEGDQIKVFTSDCRVLDTPYESCKEREDWQVTDGSRDFGGAIRALKAGKRVARKGWNGKNMYIYMVRGRMVDKENLRNEAYNHAETDHTDVTTFLSHIDMVTADGSVCVGWLASQTDMLSEDWFVIQ